MEILRELKKVWRMRILLLILAMFLFLAMFYMAGSIYMELSMMAATYFSIPLSAGIVCCSGFGFMVAGYLLVKTSATYLRGRKLLMDFSPIVVNHYFGKDNSPELIHQYIMTYPWERKVLCCILIGTVAFASCILSFQIVSELANYQYEQISNSAFGIFLLSSMTLLIAVIIMLDKETSIFARWELQREQLCEREKSKRETQDA